MTDLRKSPRYESHLEIALYPSLSYEIKLLVRSSDISKDGMRVVIPNEILKGSDIIVKCKIPTQEEQLTISGEVVWIKKLEKNQGLFNAGIKFSTVSLGDVKRLQDYLKLLKEQEDAPKDSGLEVSSLDDQHESRNPAVGSVDKKNTQFFIIIVSVFIVVVILIIYYLSKYINTTGVFGIHY